MSREEDGSVVEKAPAKINLALHVTGRRDDGYHELDSLVAFASVSDCIRICPAECDSFDIDGPFSGELKNGSENLVTKARDLLRERAGTGGPVHVQLTKNLPVASGIGGGSADAAAALRALVRIWQLDMGRPELARTGLLLGADVPVCIYGRACRMSGIGQNISPIEGFSGLFAVLVNPGVSISTRDIFNRLELQPGQPDGQPLPAFNASQSGASWLTWLERTSNSLQPVAIEQAPPVSHALEALAQIAACRLARMSGSGATCFGLFDSMAEARKSAAQLAGQHQDWWVKAVRLN